MIVLSISEVYDWVLVANARTSSATTAKPRPCSPARAVQLLAAADTLRIRIGAPVEQINQKTNEDALARLRTKLGDVAFELVWSKGATLTTEQAITLALS